MKRTEHERGRVYPLWTMVAFGAGGVDAAEPVPTLPCETSTAPGRRITGSIAAGHGRQNPARRRRSAPVPTKRDSLRHRRRTHSIQEVSSTDES